MVHYASVLISASSNVHFYVGGVVFGRMNTAT